MAAIGPLPVLPPEVWTIVFSHLKDDPLSLLNCSRTCKTWEDLLAKQKNDILHALGLPQVMRYLYRRDMLNCRTVSPKWKSLMDGYLQTEETFNWDPVFIEHSQTKDVENQWGTTLQNASDIDQFMNEMQNRDPTYYNPFPNRVVKLKPPDEFGDTEEYNRMYLNFSNLLRAFGHHVWTCVYVGVEDSVESFRQMENIFINCPNIKSLSLGMLSDWKASEQHQGCLNWLKRQTLPKLPQLRSLLIGGYFPYIVSDPLLKAYGTQLRQLHCAQGVICLGKYFGQSNIEESLPNLNELKVWRVTGEFDVLEKIAQLKMPLERLFIEYKRSRIVLNVTQLPENYGKLSLKSVLRVANAFSTTLEQLHVLAEISDIAKSETGSFVYNGLNDDMQVPFPKLKQFSVPFSLLHIQSLDRLLRQMVNLQHLSFVRLSLRDENLGDSDSENEGEDVVSVPPKPIVQIVKNRMNNLCKLCSPTLKRISIRHKSGNWRVIYKCSKKSSGGIRVKCIRIFVSF